MKIRRIANGIYAQVSTLQWAENELAGNVRYLDTSPALLEVELESGTLSLLPWEDLPTKRAQKREKKQAGTVIGEAARASASMISSVLSAPSRLFTGSGEAAPGDKYFSKSPLPFDVLNNLNALITGRMDSISGTGLIIKNLDVDGRVKNGRLLMNVNANYFNQGAGSLKLDVNGSVVPPIVKLETAFEHVIGASLDPAPPRSGYASLESVGHSIAELAGKLNGQVFLELGEGPFAYDGFALINADLATRVFRNLIPGMQQTQPILECGVSMINFKGGHGITPYGYALRTQPANLVSHIELDLEKELLQIRFDTRSREGVGLSIGNVFSNTVQIRGPLTNPGIVPHTSGLMWRGWAAFMTAGLSVVGESVMRRALSSENPCEAVRKAIRKNVCHSAQPLASSHLVCTTSEGASPVSWQ